MLLSFLSVKTRLVGLILVSSTFVFAQPVRQNVVLVIIDGARYSETLGNPSGIYTPRMKSLANEGSIISNFLNDSITITKYGIPAIWCGSWSTPKDTTVNGNSTQYATVPTVWEYYRKHFNRDSLNAFYLLKQLSSPWLPSYYPGYGPAYWPSYILQGWSDTQVWQNARTKLQTHHPQLTVLYLADVDAAGHSGNWATYTKAISTADSIVGVLWDFIQSDPVYKNCTDMIVTNDHGRHLDGVSTGFIGHGDGCYGCRHIMLLGIGPGIKSNYTSGSTKTIPDITPTIGTLLNFPTTICSGSPMIEILSPVYYQSVDTLNFGGVRIESSAVKNIIIHNLGGVQLSVSYNEDDSGEIEFFPSSLFVAPHDSEFIEVRFTPTSANYFSKQMILQHNAKSLSDTIIVTGTGFSGDVRRIIGLNKGWNLLSLPVNLPDTRVSSIFPSAISGAYEYGGNYNQVDSINYGKGFWIKFGDTDTVNFNGIPVSEYSVDVVEGWNLIGGLSYPVLVDSITSNPADIIEGKFFGYYNGYFAADTLYPGAGYWIKANQAGVLFLK
ncbi:MAG: alkaline phosphatase family protein [Ignavibacteriales bacterium]|nr:alkaline phosphatase family protein [Ignavibacteriales bacterium]